jgi:hypothetical protein
MSIDLRPQSIKLAPVIVSTDAGMQIDLRESHPRKAPPQIFRSFEPVSKVMVSTSDGWRGHSVVPVKRCSGRHSSEAGK